jgi:hypothetical protein
MSNHPSFLVLSLYLLGAAAGLLSILLGQASGCRSVVPVTVVQQTFTCSQTVTASDGTVSFVGCKPGTDGDGSIKVTQPVTGPSGTGDDKVELPVKGGWQDKGRTPPAASWAFLCPRPFSPGLN